MILQDIGTGTIANDGSGDNPRAGANKINANNALIAAALSGAVAGGALAGTEKVLGLDGSTNKAWLLSQVAAYVAAYMAGVAPATLNEISELAAALGNDPNYATTIAAALGGKQPLDSDLTAIAALSTTTWGRALLTLADAAALRSLLGCGYVVHQSAVNSAITGTTTETTLATFTIPAGSLGPNGSAEFMLLAGYTNSVNTKTLRLRINGTQALAITLTTTASGQFIFTIANRGATNSQVANATSFVGISGAGGSEQTFSFDTTADLTITITGQLTNTGEEIRLARRRCIIYPGA
ncbi:hypothetical protein [Sphingomonas bisphenolicum]|uniref:Uncharacterized protein n=1 Tax=Sphingomonas bisphenolicum TaxID=296544 RepID=A0ABN5WD10_9SPHN|nr:hypothetical protein [Sphingomonas bisphenolicum]BBF70181.1 hypothetical protein SBA_ch1_23810 [Sphingomonas bisphenolicum]